jgi:N-acetylneuraminate synthase/N,N'-diacetyllegionaminate synthase
MSARVIIIAEAGVNHNGDLNLAKKLIDIAAASGADYVKFQTFKTEKLVTQSAKKADYQIQQNTDEDNMQFSMLKKLELTKKAHLELMQHAKDKGIAFLSTAFDEDSIDFLDELGIPFFKIPSGEITNKPYLQHVARKGKDIILSTGMADMQEVKNAIEVIEEEGISRHKITVLHCNTEYPTPMSNVNLLAMNYLESELNVKVGYSDHTLGIEVPIAAVALGAEVIEKHFTIDRTLPGPDHAASLEPEELKAMVNGIRNIELAISGSGLKEPSNSEKKNILIGRKSLHLKRKVLAGEICMPEDLIALRPGNGICPMQIDKLIGKKYKNTMPSLTQLSFFDFC